MSDLVEDRKCQRHFSHDMAHFRIVAELKRNKTLFKLSDNKCYKVFGSLPADRKNYTSATEHCKLLGDDLASMSSHIELG